jgi:hypothetical protein
MKKAKVKSIDSLLKIATLYTITQDDRMFERLTNCYNSSVLGLIRSYKNKMDESKRFLYGQAQLGACWLKLRGNPRVPSIKKTYVERYRNFGVQNFDASPLVTRAINGVCDPWIVNLVNKTLHCGLPLL